MRMESSVVEAASSGSVAAVGRAGGLQVITPEGY